MRQLYNISSNHTAGWGGTGDADCGAACTCDGVSTYTCTIHTDTHYGSGKLAFFPSSSYWRAPSRTHPPISMCEYTWTCIRTRVCTHHSGFHARRRLRCLWLWLNCMCLIVSIQTYKKCGYMCTCLGFGWSEAILEYIGYCVDRGKEG